MKTKFVIFAKYALACLFIYAGVYKIFDVSLFSSQMYQSPLLPSIFVPYIAVIVPISEIALGCFLIFSKYEYFTLLISFSLMLFFSIYLIMLFTMYSKPPCACGGILSGMGYPEHIALNICFLILSSIALYTRERT